MRTKRVWATCALIGAASAACSAQGPNAPDGKESGEETGSVGLAFTLPGSITIDKVSYSVVGPTSASDTVDVSQAASSIEFVVGDLVSGSGYTITLTASDTAGDPCKSAPTPFTIAVRQTTSLAVNLVCTLDGGYVIADAGTGSLEVDASVTVYTPPPVICPTISSFAIAPAEEQVGATSDVTVMTLPSGAPVTYTIATTDDAGTGMGSIVAMSPTAAAFTCTAAGQVRLTATTTGPLANDAGSCPPQSMSALINCEPPACPPTEVLCNGVCTDVQGDPNNCGACENVCPAHNGCAMGICTTNPNPNCAGETCGNFTACDANGTCGSTGVCGSTSAGGGLCVNGSTPCSGLTACPDGNSDCASDEICFVNSCCANAVCVPSVNFCSVTDPTPGTAPQTASSASGPTLGSR